MLNATRDPIEGIGQRSIEIEEKVLEALTHSLPPHPLQGHKAQRLRLADFTTDGDTDRHLAFR